jgi:hypothetical protein
MTGKTYRLVGRVGAGRSSYAITLPLDWARGERITEGMRLVVVYDGILVVSPPGKEGVARRALAAVMP